MGVFSLWPFIEAKFKRAIYHMLSHQKIFSFDYVYLDANALIHAAAQIIENYGQYKRLINPYENLSSDEKRKLIFERFFDNILDVITNIVPLKVLYISVDGVAVRAKQNQQRERRFVSALSRRHTEEESGKEQFDTASISPGTEFMHELSKFMHWKIRELIQTSAIGSIARQGKIDWKTIKIIYSPPSDPGEGEHKIMDYIRSLPQSEINNATHCMFGPDADLLMLTLSAHVNKMFLFRESLQFPGYVDLVNMGAIRKDLVGELGMSQFVLSKIRNEHDVSNDVIFIGFLVGNDFLPKIKMFYNLKFGLETMFGIYNDCCKITRDLTKINFLTYGDNISYFGLTSFIEKLSLLEEKFIAEQANVTAPDPRFIDHTLLKYSKVQPVPNGGGIQSISWINMPEYRIAYYKKAGIDFTALGNEDFNSKVNEMCELYLKTLIWAYKYYVVTVQSWDNAYTWHFAPFMSDLANYISGITEEKFKKLSKFELGRPALPFEQLLGILSPFSYKLLPDHYRYLMLSVDSPLVQDGYYPLKFDIDYEGVRREHLGVALLPFVNFKNVVGAYEERAKTAEYKYHRNELSEGNTENEGAYKFEWKGLDFLCDFYSDYGNVMNCRVKVTKI